MLPLNGKPPSTIQILIRRKSEPDMFALTKSTKHPSGKYVLYQCSDNSIVAYSAASDKFRPHHAVDRSTRTVSLDLVIHLARLEVPEADVSAGVTRDDELAVWTAGESDGTACGVVAAPRLLAVLSELV